MASSLGYGSCWGQMKEFSSMRNYSKKREFRISCTVHSDVLSDPYKTLRIHRGASEPEVKKAFRKLALQYHPDVCRGSNCDVKFHQINEAYNMLINNLRGEPSRMVMEMSYEDQYHENQETTGVNDQDWELWEEWMGWEGAGIRDYSSHINPYI